MMTHEPMAWLRKVEEQGAGIQTKEKISPEELLEELILMGLRLRNGINAETFQQFFGKKLQEIFDFTKLQSLVNEGFIAIDDVRIKITDKGRILSNTIIAKVASAVKIYQ